MHVCLDPLKARFLEGCRPIILLDGCFLKGYFGGHLLTAVGLIANDCIYPIAWARVDKENHDNWSWFLELLAGDLGINNSNHWAFMSDRQKVCVFMLMNHTLIYLCVLCFLFMYCFCLFVLGMLM